MHFRCMDSEPEAAGTFTLKSFRINKAAIFQASERLHAVLFSFSRAIQPCIISVSQTLNGIIFEKNINYEN